MRLARAMGSDRIAWSLRRLHCPVDPGALVLEVGSGGNPYARSNVLLDAYPETRERHWVPLTIDRPFVFGFLERLPFRDRAFDFVIASHVLEHSPAPERAIAEMQRVACAGYVEVPDAFMERINPYKDHRAEITVRDGRLVIRKKGDWVVDRELVELYADRANGPIARELIPSRPFSFHVRYYWEDHIDFRILNPEVDAGWPAPADASTPPPVPSNGWREPLRRLLRHTLSQTARNRRIDLAGLLACPDCHSAVVRRADAYACAGCGSSFPDRHGVPTLNPAHLTTGHVPVSKAGTR
jgi:SAM-dependent methyltransferase